LRTIRKLKKTFSWNRNPNAKALMPNQIQSSNVKNFDFGFWALICHLDFVI
jgi:hypothetical protein